MGPGRKGTKQVTEAASLENASGVRGKKKVTMADEVKVEKLKSAKDWPVWKYQVTVVLRSLEVEGLVLCDLLSVDKPTQPEGLVSAGDAPAENAAHQAAVAAWTKADAKIQRILVTAVDKSLITHFMSCRSAKEIWQKLEALFEMKTEDSIDQRMRLVRNPEFHKRTKHIDVMYHFIRQHFQEKTFELEYVPTADQVADIFTKPLGKEKFNMFKKALGIVDEPDRKGE